MDLETILAAPEIYQTESPFRQVNIGGTSYDTYHMPQVVSEQTQNIFGEMHLLREVTNNPSPETHLLVRPSYTMIDYETLRHHLIDLSCETPWLADQNLFEDATLLVVQQLPYVILSSTGELSINTIRAKGKGPGKYIRPQEPKGLITPAYPVSETIFRVNQGEISVNDCYANISPFGIQFFFEPELPDMIEPMPGKQPLQVNIAYSYDMTNTAIIYGTSELTSPAQVVAEMATHLQQIWDEEVIPVAGFRKQFIENYDTAILHDYLRSTFSLSWNFSTPAVQPQPYYAAT